MKLPHESEYDTEQCKALRKARILEYLSLAYLISIIIMMYFVMGSSQAMKAAWIEDCLALIPPICFLFGSYICRRRPTKYYPYGFHRATSILFLCASMALLFMGTYLLINSAMKLISRAHPTIGMQEFFGHDMWLGWWMVPVLMWGTFIPICLGRAKIKYAKILNDKILITDGKMNKADWMTSLAAFVGIMGVGIGLWWVDAVAAAFIAVDILKDGFRQSKDAVTGLINRSPTSLDNGYIDLPDKVKNVLLDYEWIDDAAVRLYEHGHVIYGEGFVASKNNNPVPPEFLAKATEKICRLDWRLQSFSITLMPYQDE